MSRATVSLTEPLREYLLEVSLREPEVLQELREETDQLEAADMQIAPEQGQFMAVLLQATGARRVLEIGTFTGYSATVMALALPPDGRVIACDKSAEWTSVARKYWERAGVADKIDLRLGPALDTLEALLRAGEANQFDFAFIDADKVNLDRYYEACLILVRPGGTIAIDNTLWSGRTIDDEDRSVETEAMRAINRKLQADARVSLSLVPIGDGLTLAVKRPGDRDTS